MGQISAGGIYGGVNAGAAGVASGTLPFWKAGGATGCIAAYQAKGAVSYAASKTDLSGNGNNATDGTAFPTWAAASGWAFASASSQYLLTPVVVGNGYTVLIRIVSWTFGGGAESVLAASDATNQVSINQGAASERRYRYGTNARVATSVTTAPGVRGMAGVNAYWYDGTLTTDFTNLDNVGSTFAVYIGARNGSGTATNFANAVIAAVAIFNNVLSSAVWTAVASAMSSL